jgi:3-oxoacyl-[acyl-carrier-protein] synthase II
VSERRVAVTGVGLITPLGDELAAVHDALCAASSGLSASAEAGGVPVGEVRGFAAERYLGEGMNVRPLDRSGRLLAAAAARALAAAGFSAEQRAATPVGLVAGTLFGGLRTISEFDRRQLEAGPTYVKPLDFANSVINAAAGQAAIWHRLPGVNATIAGGPTAGLQAIAYAADLIRAGRAAAILAGGFEELSPEGLTAFSRAGLLCPPNGSGAPALPRPLDARRRGFALGEGAALLMLEDEASARRRRAPILARFLGGASGADGERGEREEAAAAALARAVTQALAEAGVEAGSIDAVSLSARGSVPLDRAEAIGVGSALGERAASLPVTAVKSLLGESLGAAGALQAAMLVAAMQSGRLPGVAGLEQLESGLPLLAASADTREVNLRTGLVTALGLDGGVCAAVFERAEGK